MATTISTGIIIIALVALWFRLMYVKDQLHSEIFWRKYFEGEAARQKIFSNHYAEKAHERGQENQRLLFTVNHSDKMTRLHNYFEQRPEILELMLELSNLKKAKHNGQDI